MNSARDIKLTDLRRDGGTQPRDHISLDVAKEYALAITEGAVLPPVTVYFDGAEYWLADGFHRALAHELLEIEAIAADVHQGDRRAAILWSVGANASHGYRRTNLDKRRAVITLLNDPEWSGWSDRKIASMCSVGRDLVGELRPKPTVGNDSCAVRTFVKVNGTPSTMKVGAIGKSREPQLVAGRVPDHRPARDFAMSEACGLGSASKMTGFTVRRLAGFARAGEIDGAVKESGSWMFDTAKLTAWMQGPGAVPEVTDNTEAQYDLDEGAQILAITDAIELLATGPSADDFLVMWGRSRGNSIPQDTIDAAGAWMAQFVVRYPEVDRKRQMVVADMLQRIDNDVAQ